MRTCSLDQVTCANRVEVELGDLARDRTAGPEQQCLARAEGEQIQQALGLLPDAYRIAIILTHIEDWTYEEVARRMRCPVGTVRSRLHRGRRLLRHYLRQMPLEEAPLSTARQAAMA